MTEPIRLHAIFSPSGAKAAMICAGKLLMEKGLPDDHNEYSDEGTCAHAIGALCLTENEPAKEYVGRAIDVSEGHGKPRMYVFREDMVDPLQVYVDLVRAYHKSLPGSTLHVEVKVPTEHMTGEKGATGTADAVIVGLDEIIVVDLKFGMGVEVTAEENPQPMMYGSGAIKKFDDLDSIKRLRCVISQPRINVKPSEWDCSLERLRAFEAEVANAAALSFSLYNGTSGTEGERFGLVPHEDACRFCKAKPTCPALAEFVADNLGVGFEVLGEDNSQRDIVSELVPASLEDLGRKFRAIPLIEDWAKAIRARAEGLLFETHNSEETQKALGIKLVQGKQGNRAWIDPAVTEGILKQWRVRQEDMYSFSLLSPTQIEKFIKAHGKKGWLEKTAALVSRSPGKPSVASIDDKRPALVLTPNSEGFDVAVPESLEDLG